MKAEAQRTRSPKVTAKRRARREALLAEASRQINEHGAGAIALNDIADKVGLSRNALYYYVEDRADLVFLCYLRSCEAVADDLATAAEESDDPVTRIRLFTERILAFDRPPAAVLSDIDFLPDDRAAIVRKQELRNVATLAHWMADGTRSGALRSCQPDIIAHSLLGQISWSLLSGRWLAHRDGPRARQRMSAAIIDLLLNGIASNRSAAVRCDIDVNQLAARPFNAFDRHQAAAMKVDQLVAAASRQFNRKGIDGASLDDIGAEVGATKGTVYHYFQDKTQLVVHCYQRAFDLYELIMATSRRNGSNGLERAINALHLNVQAMAGPLSPMLLQPGFLNLPEQVRDQLAQRGRRLRRASTDIMRAGASDGSCRPLDTTYAAEVSAGVFFWLPKWLPQMDASLPKPLADELADCFAFGIRARAS